MLSGFDFFSPVKVCWALVKTLSAVITADDTETVLQHHLIAAILPLFRLPVVPYVAGSRWNFYPSEASRAFDKGIDTVHAADHIESGVLKALLTYLYFNALGTRKRFRGTHSHAQLLTSFGLTQP